MRLAHASCDSRNTSWRFALGASSVCVVGENLTCSVPALEGCGAVCGLATLAMRGTTGIHTSTGTLAIVEMSEHHPRR